MSSTTEPTEYADRARAWAAALRAGDTRTWAEFRAHAGTAPSADPSAPRPGSAQLELVRRLALHAPAAPDFAALADLVLGSASPGRGLVDTPLPGDDAARFGSPAVEPDLLPADELVRAATAVLVQLLTTAGTTPPAAPDRGARWRRRGFVLLGAPGTAAEVRRALVAAGWREGGFRPTYLVLGGPLEDLMAERWAARVQSGAGMRWRRMWRTAATLDRLPPGIRLPELAAGLADQVGAARVHVVLGADPAGVVAAVGTALGVALAAPTARRTDVVGADLLRRLNPLLVLAVGEDGRRDVVAGAWAAASAAVPDPGGYDAGLAAPRAMRAWAASAGAATAARLAAAHEAGDYAVHGDPDLLVPAEDRDRPAAVDPADTLELALGLVAELWRRANGGTA